MRFILNTNKLIQTMYKNDVLINNTGRTIRVFPFPANSTQLNLVRADLKSFISVAGSCLRECLSLKSENIFNKEKFIENICVKADVDKSSELIKIIEKILFDESGQLNLIDPFVYPFILSVEEENKTLRDISKFLNFQLIDDDDRILLRELLQQEPDNLFFKLMFSCMPSLEQHLAPSDTFYKGLPKLKLLFKSDLRVLLDCPQLFVGGFHQLLKLYFFLYVSEMSMELGSFFKERNDKLFFSVKGEKLQKHRLPIDFGWSMFELNIKPLFTHSVTLELLNYISGFDVQGFTYKDIKTCVGKLSSDEKENLNECIVQLKSIYISWLPKIEWNKLEFDYNHVEENFVFRSIIELFQIVDYQFKTSKKERAKMAYQDWIKEFTKLSFVKKRGPLGNSLSLDYDFFLLLTKLCLGDQKRIKLKNLWESFELRGINLDESSRKHLLQYYQKINLLEKKSDSGDAQYVKRFSLTIS